MFSFCVSMKKLCWLDFTILDAAKRTNGIIVMRAASIGIFLAAHHFLCISFAVSTASLLANKNSRGSLHQKDLFYGVDGAPVGLRGTIKLVDQGSRNTCWLSAALNFLRAVRIPLDKGVLDQIDLFADSLSSDEFQNLRFGEKAKDASESEWYDFDKPTAGDKIVPAFIRDILSTLYKSGDGTPICKDGRRTEDFIRMAFEKQNFVYVELIPLTWDGNRRRIENYWNETVKGALVFKDAHKVFQVHVNTISMYQAATSPDDQMRKIMNGIKQFYGVPERYPYVLESGLLTLLPFNNKDPSPSDDDLHTIMFWREPTDGRFFYLNSWQGSVPRLLNSDVWFHDDRLQDYNIIGFDIFFSTFRLPEQEQYYVTPKYEEEAWDSPPAADDTGLVDWGQFNIPRSNEPSEDPSVAAFSSFSGYDQSVAGRDDSDIAAFDDASFDLDPQDDNPTEVPTPTQSGSILRNAFRAMLRLTLFNG